MTNSMEATEIEKGYLLVKSFGRGRIVSGGEHTHTKRISRLLQHTVNEILPPTVRLFCDVTVSRCNSLLIHFNPLCWYH